MPGPSSRCANKANLVTEQGKQLGQSSNTDQKEVVAEKSSPLGIFGSSITSKKEIKGSQKPYEQLSLVPISPGKEC